MATAVSAMSSTAFNNICMEPDMESFIDFGAHSSPSPGSSHLPPSTSASALTSPTSAILPLESHEDLQTPAKPSHEYERWKQQTGLPSNSVPGLQSLNQPFNGNFQQGFSNSGIGFDDVSLMGSGLEAGWSSGLGMSADANMDMDFSMSSNSSSLPAFFFPPGDASQSDDFVDPSAISNHEQPPAPVRVWPGMHQQQALAAKAAQQQRQMIQQQQKQRTEQQQRAQPAQRSRSHQPTDPRTEETIARVVNQIRKASTLSSQDGSISGASGVHPHIVRMKKDEDDMDEDERLLASEEGKKLSSKERRQLRNKVSARAFRSRRKEYIGQLEGEVAVKTNECNELRLQNHALMEENARSRAFIEKLLRHPAFTPFLEDLSRDESLNTTIPAPRPASTISSTPTPTQNSTPQQFQQMPQAENPQVNMTLIPETHLDMSMLNLNQNWGMQNAGFTYQPQVYAVLELPEGPCQPIDTDVLSGKGGFMTEIEPPVAEVKPDYPVIERPIEVKSVEPVAPVEEEDEEERDPAFTLYYDSPAPSKTASTIASPVEVSTSLFGDVAPEKVFAHFELFISNDADSQALMERLERLCARMNPVFERLQALTSHLDMDC